MFYTNDSCSKSWKASWLIWMILVVFLQGGCSGTGDDLLPSGEDKRSPVESGAIGGDPGNIAPDFALVTTDNTTFVLSDHLVDGSDPIDAVVLYFTMWCPVCSAHMDNIQFEIMPRFVAANIVYLAVDYLSDSVVVTRAAQQEAGFVGGGWLAAPDAGQVVTNAFHATMGTTVVIDGDGVVRMNEDFRNGDNLTAVLASLTGL